MSSHRSPAKHKALNPDWLTGWKLIDNSWQPITKAELEAMLYDEQWVILDASYEEGNAYWELQVGEDYFYMTTKIITKEERWEQLKKLKSSMLNNTSETSEESVSLKNTQLTVTE